MLTPSLLKTLIFIESYIAQHGMAPTVREISAGTGRGRVISNTHRILQALEDRGYIKRLRRRARALEVIKASPPILGFDNETRAF